MLLTFGVHLFSGEQIAGLDRNQPSIARILKILCELATPPLAPTSSAFAARCSTRDCTVRPFSAAWV